MKTVEVTGDVFIDHLRSEISKLEVVPREEGDWRARERVVRNYQRIILGIDPEKMYTAHEEWKS